MTDYLHELNESQRMAVEYTDGPALVIAGAGSGKTRVLTYKIAYLLEQGYAPASILALTFTNKAAREMRERISAQLEHKEYAARLWMGTFHSIFYRILRAEAPFINFNPNFTIYDTSDSKSLIKTIVKEMQLDEKKYKPSVVLASISRAKNRLMLPEDYCKSVEIRTVDTRNEMGMTGEIYREYFKRCRQSNAMDFDDLLLYTFLLFRNFPEVCERYQERFRYILVDEYQDTNYAQHAIIWQLAHKHQRICVVGDDAQSIYSFRGAEIENILGFTRQYEGARIFKLEQNYRSTQTIVEAANSLIAHNRNQIKKKVFSEKESGDPIQVLSAFSDLEEGEIVAHKIQHLNQSRNIAFSDIAVLYRTNAQSRIFEEVFRKKGLPYRIYGGLSFYQRKEIKDIIAYFRMIINPHDEEAFKRIVNYPARGIGQVTIDKVMLGAYQGGVSAWEAICAPATYLSDMKKAPLTKLIAFRDLIQKFRNMADSTSVFQLTDSLIRESGILADLQRDMTAEGLARQDNVQELINGIISFEQTRKEEGSEDVSLIHFLQEVSLMSDVEESNEDEGDEKITLMTVHAAKGLEFRVVFIVGMEENLFPSAMSGMGPRQQEEERRLFYVALTRAEELCFLSYAGNRFRYGKMEFASPSRFLKEIDTSCLSSGRAKRSEPVAPKLQTAGRLVRQPVAASPAVSHSSVSVGGGTLSVGQRISHERFGIGTIKAIEGSGENLKATVEFQNLGVKQLLLKFARFTILD